MVAIFEILSWFAALVLIFSVAPQIILNFRRGSTEGASWLTFLLLLFGLSTLFVRSLFTTDDIILRLNYGAGAFVTLTANLQFVYYRFLKVNQHKHHAS